MGVDCDICLPHTARVRDVADVLATLAGAPGHLRVLHKNSDHETPVFESDAVIEIKPFPDSPTLYDCLDVYIKVPYGADWQFISGQPVLNPMWFFDFGIGRSIGGLKHQRQGRGFKGRSTAFWVAAARGLIDFFGGAADFDDCDNTDIDYDMPAAVDLAAHDGVAWDRFQQRLASVKPLTVRDLDWGAKRASDKTIKALR